MDHSLDDAILLYRKLFYSTDEVAPDDCSISEMLDHIDKWTLNSTPVVIDYGGSFQTKHLHLIQHTFPHAEIYSIDTLYEELDLLVCNINQDETKWCFIPVFRRSGEFNQDSLVACLQNELEGALSFYNGIKISALKFSLKIDHLPVYDPYSEVFGFKKINFIDSTKKCEIVPCCLFMAYHTYHATPCVERLEPKGLIDPIYTKIDLHRARGRNYLTDSRGNEKLVTTNNSRNNECCNVYAALDELQSIWPEKIKIFSSPSSGSVSWLDTRMISTLLDGAFSKHTNRHYFGNSVSHRLSLWCKYFSFVECLNLNSSITQNSIKAVTPSDVRQLIEEHVGGFWKNDGTSTQRYPKKFIKECLRELLDPVKNLHIYIDSCESLLYSLEFVRQPKDEDRNLHIELSFSEEVKHSQHQSAVILAFECNHNYVLVFAKLDAFLALIKNCTSLENIQTEVESSVTFAFANSCGQDVKWHRNLSFAYVAAFQDSVINQSEARLLAAGLNDMNFISKKLEQVNFDESAQCHTNDAIICFNFNGYPGSFYSILPFQSELLDPWIFNEDTCKFTGPIVTLFPNASEYTIGGYPKPTARTDLGSVYSLLCDSISILFQWRN